MENLTIHVFNNFSHWSLDLIFSFPLVCGYSSPHILPDAELEAKT